MSVSEDSQNFRQLENWVKLGQKPGNREVVQLASKPSSVDF